MEEHGEMLGQAMYNNFIYTKNYGDNKIILYDKIILMIK